MSRRLHCKVCGSGTISETVQYGIVFTKPLYNTNRK